MCVPVLLSAVMALSSSASLSRSCATCEPSSSSLPRSSPPEVTNEESCVCVCVCVVEQTANSLQLHSDSRILVL